MCCQKKYCKYCKMSNRYDSNMITNELNKIVTWFNSNKLVLNADKTKCMFFHNPQRNFEPFKIKINDIEIEIVDSFNFLGINFDKISNWNNYITKISAKIY